MPLKESSQSNQRKTQLLKICKALPELIIEPTGDHLSFKIRKKTLAYYLFDHHGDGMIAFCCKSSLSEQRRLVASDADTFFVPSYVGPKGWVGVRMDLPSVDWTTIEELARTAYQSLAPRKMAVLVETLANPENSNH